MVSTAVWKTPADSSPDSIFTSTYACPAWSVQNNLTATAPPANSLPNAPKTSSRASRGSLGKPEILSANDSRPPISIYRPVAPPKAPFQAENLTSNISASEYKISISIPTGFARCLSSTSPSEIPSNQKESNRIRSHYQPLLASLLPYVLTSSSFSCSLALASSTLKKSSTTSLSVHSCAARIPCGR